MKDNIPDQYYNAHLFVAAIRILTHQTYEPPSLEAVCQSLSISLEQGGNICRRLEDMMIIETVSGAYGARLFVRDHLKIEELPREKDSRLDEELRRFRQVKRKLSEEVHSIAARQDERKKSLFAELDKQLKGGKP